jgi:hypothetical protein
MDGEPTTSGGEAQPSIDPVAELRTKFIALEYEYLSQSSFHTDDMRNKFIEFYLLIVGAAATAILGLAQLESSAVPTWAFSVVAFLIGALGVVMLPVFARARRVVLECLQGTVLLKRYVEEVVSEDQAFSHALLWDAHSLPTDERYGTASFLLVFLFMLLDSAMFMLATLLMLSERLPVPAAILWSLAIGACLLTAQIVFYRCFLWLQIRRAMKSDRLKDKWDKLGIDAGATIQEPALREPVIRAFLVGGIIIIGLALAASRLAPLGAVLGF